MITTHQIGKCGELLVQLRLLISGFESAQMTTDSGVDLVAYSPRRKKAVTIQVKANLRPKPAGGKGRPALGWWIDEQTPANVVALVDLASSRIWLFKMEEVRKHAQQHSSGRFQIYMYVDPKKSLSRRKNAVEDFSRHLFENKITAIL